MRAMLIAGILAATLLAGCSGDEGSPTGSGTDTMTSGTTTGSTDTTTGGTGTVPGNDTTLECVVTAGGPGSVSGNFGGNNVGGCQFGGANPIENDGVVKSFTLAAGCVPWFDNPPADGMTDGTPAVGDDYEEGTEFGVYCDATMAPNSANSMVVTVAL